MLHSPNLNRALNDRALDLLFREARTHYDWTDEPVSEATIRQLYDLVKFGPTSMNNSPARFVFIGTPEGKERLKPHLSPGNVDKTMSAPWTVIVARDTEFFDRMPKLFPHFDGARGIMKDGADDHGPRNATLQGAYLILAARALGLDTGPMSGFDKAGLDDEFFTNDPERKTWTADFLVNLGYGTGEKIFPRLPRLDFDEAALIV